MIRKRRTEAINVVIVEDKLFYRRIIADQLTHGHREILLLGEGGSAEEAVHLTKRYAPDVIVLDLGIPRRPHTLTHKSVWNGIAALRAIRMVAPTTRLLIYSHTDTDSHDTGILFALHQLEIDGYLAKRDESEEMLADIVECVVRGDQWFSPLVAPLFRNIAALTDREGEVLDLLVRGRTNEAIARQLTIAETTVKSHVSSILSKLYLRAREELLSSDEVSLGAEDDLLKVKRGDFTR